jgi:hypothetical protein
MWTPSAEKAFERKAQNRIIFDEQKRKHSVVRKQFGKE